MKSLLVIAIVSGFLVVTIVNGSIAGHNYHGYGMKMSEMSQIDSDGDGEITFDEFSAPTVDKLKSGLECWTRTTIIKSAQKSGMNS